MLPTLGDSPGRQRCSAAASEVSGHRSVAKHSSGAAPRGTSPSEHVHVGGEARSQPLVGGKQDVIDGADCSMNNTRKRASGGGLDRSGTSWYLPLGAIARGRRGTSLPPMQEESTTVGIHPTGGHAAFPGPE